MLWLRVDHIKHKYWATGQVFALWQVRRRYRRAPHEIELEGGVRLAAARTHDREGEACRLVWNAGRIVILGLRFSVIRYLPLGCIDRFFWTY